VQAKAKSAMSMHAVFSARGGQIDYVWPPLFEHIVPRGSAARKRLFAFMQLREELIEMLDPEGIHLAAGPS